MSSNGLKTLEELKVYFGADLIKKVGPICLDLEVSHLCRHASHCSQNSVFIATAGLQSHASEFVVEASSAGAQLMITDRWIEQLPNGMTIWFVPNLAERLSNLAGWFYDYPSKKLKLIGITGTNGKTTTSFLVAQALNFLGYRVALMGTLGAGLYPNLVDNGHTTPDSFTIQAWLHEAVQQGCPYAVMEVSSHAVVQSRIAGLAFEIKALTQVSQDHLDFHGTLEAYQQAKLNFFTADAKTASQTWVINLADAMGQQALRHASRYSPHVKLAAYSSRVDQLGLEAIADHCLALGNKQPNLRGYALLVNWQNRSQLVTMPLLGEYNIENLFCSLRVLLALGFSINQLVNLVGNLTAPPGRLERVACVKPLNAVVDFAHTTDALRQVLETINQQRQAVEPTSQLWVVFGCGGNRDQSKRPEMTRTAYALADRLILTSDNPRNEPLDLIINEMLAGLPDGYDPSRVLVEPNRKQAIVKALKQAQDGDWVLIAGKGHEKTQEINGCRYAFSDQQVIKEWTA